MKECRRSFKDQMGREIEISFPPKRIVSLVPSQTELLFDLGLDERVVGATKFCIHPADRFKSTAKVGGTKQLRLNQIRELKPDLIIGNKEENEKGQIDELMQEFPVWMSDIHTLEDAFGMMKAVGEITGKADKAKALVHHIDTDFQPFKNSTADQPARVAYLIWKDPYMVAGHHTFINDMLEIAGWTNAFRVARYPVVSLQDIKQANPDVIFLSSEPYPFKEKHLAEFKAICPEATVLVVDGELFSWYGSRLKHTPQYLKSLQAVVNQKTKNNNENKF